MNAQPPISPPAPREQRGGMVLAHLLGLLMIFGLLTGTIAALVYWLITKDDNSKPFVQDQAKEALNFQLNVLFVCVIWFMVSLVFTVILIGLLGFVLLPLVILVALVFSIVGAVKANDGELYRYPLIYRFIQ